MTALKVGKPSGTDQNGDFHKYLSVTLHVHTYIRRSYISRMAELIMSKIIVSRSKILIDDFTESDGLSLQPCQ